MIIVILVYKKIINVSMEIIKNEYNDVIRMIIIVL